MNFTRRLVASYLLINLYQPALIAGAPIVKATNLSGTVSIPKNGTGSLNILLTLNASVPSPLKFLLTSKLPQGVSIVTQGTSPCQGTSTFCNNTFSLTPGNSCCLALSLNASELNIGSNSFNMLFQGGVPSQPIPNPSSYPFQTGTLKINVTPQDVFYTVTPNSDANGTISPSTPQEVAYGHSTSFTATPNTNYVVDQWLVNATPAQVGGSSFTLTNVTSDTDVTVTFTSTPPAQLSVSPTSLSFTASSSDEQSVEVTNNSDVTTVEDLTATIPGGSSVTISSQTCTSSLAPHANCTYSFLPGATLGNTDVTFAGSNTTTPAPIVSITTTAPPTTTISASSPQITFNYPAGNSAGSGEITITNTGSNYPALNVQADLSNLTCTGSYTNIQATRCDSIAPNGGTCTITFSTSSPNSEVCLPGTVTIAGANTAASINEPMAFAIADYYIFALNSDSSILSSGTHPQGISTSVANNLAFDSSCSDMPPYRCHTTWSGVSSNLYTGSTNTSDIISTASTASHVEDVQAANNCNDIITDNTGTVAAGTWYLPAVCQMSLSTNGSTGSCTNSVSTTILNLNDLGFTALDHNLQLWTSTISAPSYTAAYLEFLSIPSGYASGMQADKQVICAREINPGD